MHMTHSPPPSSSSSSSQSSSTTDPSSSSISASCSSVSFKIQENNKIVSDYRWVSTFIHSVPLCGQVCFLFHKYLAINKPSCLHTASVSKLSVQMMSQKNVQSNNRLLDAALDLKKTFNNHFENILQISL